MVICDFYPLEQVKQLNQILRSLNKGLVVSGTSGLLGFCFTDFSNHTIFDKDGEPNK